MMDMDAMETEETSYTLKGTSETLLPLQLFEFKTHLLEAVEELRMSRIARVQYEEQISKVLMEKQELTWKIESFSNQEEMLEKRHKDATTLLKKQLQTKMCTVEEEKGCFQLAAETKEREIIGLREEMKTLQCTKYSLEKKIQEMEQKLQVHLLVKEDHMKQLNECEKCFGNVMQQFGMLKDVHEKLEQSVQIAIQKNKKLKAEVKQKDDEIGHLKEELKKMSSDTINYKVNFQERASKEKISLIERENQLKELKERLQMERDINKRLTEDNTFLKENKQENVKTLANMTALVQRHTQTIVQLENQLSALEKKYETLERDNELQRANATENEEKFLVLQSENENALKMWKEQEQRMNTDHEAIKKELESVKESFKQLQECNLKPLSNDLETIKQVHEQPQITKNINTEAREPGSCDYSTDIDQVDDSINLNPDSSNAMEIHPKEKKGNGPDLLCNDMIRLSNIYSTTDKTKLCEEQKSSSELPENKADFSAAQANLEQSCDGKPTEEISADRMGPQNADEDGESAATCLPALHTPAIMESVKLLLDNNKPPTVCSQNAIQQTVCSHHKSGDGTSEVVYIVIDKTDTTENNQGVLKNETHTKESQLFPPTVTQLINTQTADAERSATSNRDGYATLEGNIDATLNVGISDLITGPCSGDEKKQPSEDQIQVIENSRLCEELSMCKQTREDRLQSKGNREHVLCTAEMESDIIGLEQTICQVESDTPSSSDVSVKTIYFHNKQDRQDQSKQDSRDAKQLNNSPVNGGNCPLVVEEAKKLAGINASEANDRKELLAVVHSVNICQTAEQNSEPLYVDKENIESGNNLLVNFSIEESQRQTRLEPFRKAGPENIKEQVNTDSQSAMTAAILSNTSNPFFLPRAGTQNSLHCVLPTVYRQGSENKRLAFDILPPIAHAVSRKGHSTDWNATTKKLRNSPFPAEHSSVTERLNCPDESAATTTSSTSLSATQLQGEKESSSSSIQDQLNAIEKFLLHHRLNETRKRKLESGNSAEEL